MTKPGRLLVCHYLMEQSSEEKISSWNSDHTKEVIAPA